MEMALRAFLWAFLKECNQTSWKILARQPPAT